MDSTRQLQKKYGTRAMMIAIAVWIVFYVMDMQDIGRGFLLGTLVSVINFVLMGESLRKRFGLEGRKLTVNIYASLGLRFLIMAIALYVGIVSERFNVFAVIVGLFMIQIMIIAHHLLMNLFPKRFHE